MRSVHLVKSVSLWKFDREAKLERWDYLVNLMWPVAFLLMGAAIGYLCR